jgi:hypothetical protein
MTLGALKLSQYQTQPQLAGLVRVGLEYFWRQSLPHNDRLPALLRAEAGALLGPDADLEWEALRERFEKSWPLTQGPLGRLIQDAGLTLAEAFLLTLAGETESAHLVTLALSELQAPAASGHPSVHLCVALLNALFGDRRFTALDVNDMGLVRHQILILDPDGPLPLRTLRLEPALWSIWCERRPTWPECTPIALSERHLLPEPLRQELPALATLLIQGRMRGLIVRGHPGSGRGLTAAELATALDRSALHVPVEIWQKQPAFAVACRYAGWLPVITPALGAGETWNMPETLFETPCVIRLGMDGAVAGKHLLEIQIPLPAEQERRAIWSRHIADRCLVEAVAECAQLSAMAITEVAQNAALLARQAHAPVDLSHIARARQVLGAERLRLLAHPVTQRVTRAAIVLPPLVEQAMAQIIARAQRRESIWQGLGITLQAARNTGLRVLFVGESGTGKTLAAAYLATALGAPLYRADLAAIMNKYIGESEKNLGALLDLAAAADVVLLFDEADSLFGRRGDAKHSGERYANMLTNFLLTRIENHPGVVILTTNSRERIDSAFARRIDAVVEFPLPGFDERLQLWQRHLGERSPGDGICKTLASYCDLAGGQIRNVVLTAAGISAQRPPDAIAVPEILQALHREYQKLGRMLPPQLEGLGK